jgi:stearoyl-CoA desaturase (delta-9 desaturase)
MLWIIDPYLVLFAYVIPAGYCLHTLGLVNCVIHRWGYKNYEGQAGESRNNVLLAILTLGANGWHNNHHATPSDWKHGKRKWEIDPTSLIIRMMKK